MLAPTRGWCGISPEEFAAPVAGMLGSNVEGLRRSNLSTVLTLIHRDRAISRSALAARTGLNRSTIAVLVGELISLGVVEEAPQAAAGVPGRPGNVVTALNKVVAITVHPEIDAIQIAIVGLGRHVLKTIRYETARIPTAQEAVNVITAVLAGMRQELDRDRLVVGIGAAIPGLVASKRGEVVLAPHLGWEHEPFATMLADSTGLPVFVGNDASLGVLAELRFGAAQDRADVVYLNGGASGIGGGIIANGDLVAGANGFGGELGHTLVRSGGIACHCGASGCLETEVQRQPLLDALGLTTPESSLLNDRLLEAYRNGAVSAELAAVVDRQVEYLSVALTNFVNIFNPEIILLGGFLGSVLEVSGGAISALVQSRALPGSRDAVHFERAALGDDLMAIGSAEIAFEDALADPMIIARISQRAEDLEA